MAWMRTGMTRGRRAPRTLSLPSTRLLRRGVYFSLVSDWGHISSHLSDRHAIGVYLHPNPLIALLTAAACALAAAALAVAAALALYSRAQGGTARGAARRGRQAAAAALEHARPGGAASLLCAYLLHWLPYATQSRQTFLLYYLPAYYFAILLFARAWHHAVRMLPGSIPAAALTLAVVVATGWYTWQICPIAYGSPVHVGEWTGILRLASTECWWGAPCWVNKQ